MISERKRIAAEKRSTGEGKKAEILGKVERELKVILSEANREASEIMGKADATATKIYGDIYGQDPDFFSFYKTLQSYSEVIGKNTSLILSADSDLFHYLQKVDRK
jgi:membrane protease subunit HflC